MDTQDLNRPVFLPIIIGTPRQGRLTEPAASFVFGEVSKRRDIETELIDIRKIPIRMDDAGEALKDSQFSATVTRADGLILDPATAKSLTRPTSLLRGATGFQTMGQFP